MLALFIAVFVLVKLDAQWPWWAIFAMVVFCTAIMALTKHG
jgi:uncharacterized membrane protein YccC